MGTSGGYTPPAVPACAYPTRMTRAAALALRTAGTLDVQCAIVITDGPAIGPSATVTEIELNPVSSTAFGETARVFTTYDNDAWPGIYDIDLGTGTITELRDNRGNTAKDVDSGGATVAGFPWGNANWRDNYAEDVTFTAANTQVGLITNCRFVGTTLDFTGKTAGAWTDTEILNGSVSVLGASGNLGFLRSRLVNCTITRQVGAAGSNTLNITDSDLHASTITQGGGSLVLNQVDAESLTLSNPAGAIRSLVITNLKANAATITQQRTNTTNADTLSNSVITGGSSITFTGAGDAGIPPQHSGLVIQGISTVTVANGPVGNGNPLRAVTVENNATLNVQNGGQLQNCRIGAGAIVNSGAFAHTGTVIELSGTTTLTAANLDRLKTKGFDDTI